MANRPVFTPTTKFPHVEIHNTDFTWHPGFSLSQKQLSIESLHQCAIENGYCNNPLEISSKSLKHYGVQMSAFNLRVDISQGRSTSLESVFQSSKVFEHGGPFRDLLYAEAIDAKKDPRIKESGELIGFQGKNSLWPIEPKTIFYDWIYLNTLQKNKTLSDHCLKHDGFTDIEFNPKRSFSCQARSAALYVALTNNEKLIDLLKNEEDFIEYFTKDSPKSNQQELF